MVGRNPKILNSGKSYWKGKTRRFFFLEIIQQVWDFSFMIPYSNKFNQLEVCFISMVPHFLCWRCRRLWRMFNEWTGQAQCFTWDLFSLYQLSSKFSFCCGKWHRILFPSFAPGKRPRKMCYFGCQAIPPKWHDFRLTTLIRLSHLSDSHVDLRCRCFSHVGRIHWSVRS